jgi:hypothetical protein
VSLQFCFVDVDADVWDLSLVLAEETEGNWCLRCRVVTSECVGEQDNTQRMESRWSNCVNWLDSVCCSAGVGAHVFLFGLDIQCGVCDGIGTPAQACRILSRPVGLT